MGKKTKSFYLVFLILILSFSSGIPHFASDLEVQEEPRTVVLSPIDANQPGYQQGSIFSQSTLAIGGSHMCAVLDNQSVMCVGDGEHGQLGNNDSTEQPLPVYTSSFGRGRTAVALTSGFSHTCAILDNGNLTCWGKGSEGQLGLGTFTDAPTPGSPITFASNQKVVTFSAGQDHTCAILDDGQVACWGDGSNGQLGKPGVTGSAVPVLTDTLGLNRSAKAIASGSDHTCAILDNGSTVCWGGGSKGQLGNGNFDDADSPTQVASFPFNLKAVALSAGEEHTCALLSQGSVACWGSGTRGMLGGGSTSDSAVPQLVESLGPGRKATALSSKFQHTCALLDDGNVTCWGDNENGRGGNNGSSSESLSPTMTASFGSDRFAIAITSGYTYTCAILNDTSTSCWGDLGYTGSLVQSVPTDFDDFPSLRTVAVSERDFNGNGVYNIFEFPVNFDFTASGLSAGAKHTCAILDDDSITCWGDNSKGQLGTGDTISQSIPVSTLSLGAGRTAQSVVAGYTQTCALLDNGSVSCWGEQYLTNDTKVILTSPTLVGDFGDNRTAVQISSGLDFSCAVLNDGNVLCWGRGASGRLGNGGNTSSTNPTQTSSFGSGRKAMSVDLYSDHACALLDDESVMCWGRNDYGKLGDGTSTQRNAPVQVNAFPTNTTPIAVSVGSHHSCALLDIGDVSCWGEGTYGQNGDGTNPNRPSPGLTSGFGEGRLAVSVASGDHHICALLDSGEVACWGDGGSGRLGNGASSMTSSPVLTSSFGEERTATSLSVGSYHGCVVLDSGQISCWGSGADGRLGNGETSNQANPVLTKTLGPSVSSISVGGDHSCALLGNGSVACWGSERVGDGRTNGSSAPVLVSSFGPGRTAVHVSSGAQGSCAILDNGSVSCWGYGSNLGNEFTDYVPTPTLTGDLGTGRTAVDLSVGTGQSHSCAVLDNGSVACWGHNMFGQLGDGTIGTGDPKPSLTGSFGAGRTAVSVTTGVDHTCALLDNGSVSCWGRNQGGQLGVGGTLTRSSPTLIAPFDSGRTAVEVSAGRWHTCALLDNGQVSCWGKGDLGQMGHGSLVNSNVPLTITHSGGISNAVSISAGYEHTCAALSNGSAMCWGSNNNGALGIGDAASNSQTYSVLVPSSLDSNRKVVDIVAGSDRTCVLYDNQSVACTGRGDSGQIGNNDTSNQVNFTYTIPLVIPRSLAIDNGDQDGDGVADPLDAYPEDIMRSVRCVVPMYGRYTCTPASLGKYVPSEAAIYQTDAGIGHYVDLVGQGEQFPCPVGRYNPTTSAIWPSECLDSDAGHFVGSIGQGVQTPCETGTYQPSTRSQACLPSGLGHYVDQPGQSVQIPCSIGTFQNQTEQTECIPAEWGHYANETGQVNQTACLVGSYNPNNGSVLSTDCVPADIGHFVNETGQHNQTVCTIGTLQNQTGQSSCLNASLGHYVLLTGQSTEIPCSVGTYNPLRGANNSSWCLPSTRGHFVNQTGQGAQTPCAPGTYNPMNGSSDSEDCVDADVGHYAANYGEWNQSECELGTFQNQTGIPLCTLAEPGHFVNQTGQTLQHPCQPGTFQRISGGWECLVATPGHYATFEAQANQTPCDVGTFNPQVGSINSSDCGAAEPGHFVNLTGQGEQMPCQIGLFNPESGSNTSSACQNASSGHYVDELGQSEQTPCPVRTFNPDEASNTSQACQLALRGTYVDQTGQSEGIPCPLGTYNPSLGMSSIEACLEAIPGSYVDAYGQSQVVLCKAGTYNPDPGSTSRDDCIWADENHFVELEGQTEQTPCPPGTFQDKPAQPTCILGDNPISDEEEITPQESFYLLFVMLGAIMLALFFVLYRRSKRRVVRPDSNKPLSKMQRRYRY